MKIYPSLISSDLLHLGKTIKLLNPLCAGYHIDVMDDHFVPNLTWGPVFVEAIVSGTELPIHLHLMVDNPSKWVKRIPLRAQDCFIFHHEVFKDDKQREEILHALHSMPHSVGVAVNPETPIEQVFPYIERVNHVLIMSVNPGFSGQEFIPDVLTKVTPLVEVREHKSISFSIGMDGGIGGEQLPELEAMGVDIVGIASAIFSQADYVSALQGLQKK